MKKNANRIGSTEKALDWSGNWIWTSDAPSEGQWINLRKTFVLNEVPSFALARIAVDSRYWMWINGEMAVYEGQLKTGPTLSSWYYDVVDLTPYLRNGENTVAILACYWGFNSASALATGNQGILFDASFSAGSLAGGSDRLISDGSWKVLKNPAYEMPPFRKNKRPDAVDSQYNAAKAIDGWQAPDFDDSAWENATVKTLSAKDPRNTLVERSIPQWKVEEIVKYGKDDWRVTDAERDGEPVKVYSIYNSTNTQGAPYLKVKSALGGELIKMMSDATAHLGGEAVSHYYVTRAGEQEWEAYNWMSAWRVDFIMPATVEVLELGWRRSTYNTEPAGHVTTDNARLNKLYQKAYDTLLITMRDIYMDCPDRERTQWWGDSVLEMQQAAYAMDANARLLYKKLMTQVIGFTRDRGGPLSTVPTNPTFMELHPQCVAGVYSLWQYYLYYGETDLLEFCYDGFMDYIKLWTVADRGYLKHRSGTSDWYDWGSNVDAGIQDHAWCYLAAESMRNVAQVLGKDQADIDFLQSRMDRIKENFVSMFWNEEMGAYYSATLNGQPDDRAQAMAVCAGLADPAHYPALREILLTTQKASPYMEKYILESLYVMGYAEDAIARTLKRYDVMLQTEHPTLYEVFNVNQLSGNNGTATRNHAWSGGPLSLLYMYNAGILSTGAGFETVRIKPCLGNLSSVSASTDTVRGEISVDATKNTLRVTVPAGCKSAEICVPRLEQATTVKLGDAVVYANGAAQKALPTGVAFAGEDAGYVNFTVIPGTYDFSMTEDVAASAATHSFTVTAEGEGTVKVNGAVVETPYTYVGEGNVVVTAIPAEGKRVGYIAGAYPEAVYSEDTVERTYTPDRDATLYVGFDTPVANKPTIRIIDATHDETTDSPLKCMPYAFRVFINGKEAYMNYYVRDLMLPMPYAFAADKGEQVTVCVKPADSKNYKVWFDDGNGTVGDELVLTMESDVTLRVFAEEKASVKKIPIADVACNSYHPFTAGPWQMKFLTDGHRVSHWTAANGFGTKGFPTETPDEPITITLDLGEAQTFNQVSLFPRSNHESLSGGARCFPADFTIGVSQDGAAYTTVAALVDHPNPYVAQQTYNFDAVQARYVKITVTKFGENNFHMPAGSRYRVELSEAEVAYVEND